MHFFRFSLNIFNMFWQVQNLQSAVKAKDQKIKELERHLTLTLQELKASHTELRELKGPENKEVERGGPRLPKRRPTRQQLNGSLTNQPAVKHDSEKYVSQTCVVMWPYCMNLQFTLVISDNQLCRKLFHECDRFLNLCITWIFHEFQRIWKWTIKTKPIISHGFANCQEYFSNFFIYDDL